MVGLANRLANDAALAKGPRGTFTGLVMTNHILMYWGIPHNDKEPICQARATAERELDHLRKLANTLAGLDHPAALRHGEEVENDRLMTEEWWTTLLEQDWTTDHSRAETADEYTALTEPLPTPARGRRIDFEAIKERVDIVDYISRHMQLRPVSGKLVGKCPLPGHEDSSPSFWVYPQTRSWYCFGCNRGGDVIHFAHAIDGTTARDLAGVA
jgi:hypothetical protein